LAQQTLDRESSEKLQRVQAESNELVAGARLEFEEEGQSSLRRALWQLQVADDCMQTMRLRQEQEAEAMATCHTELAQLRQEASEENLSCRRLAAAVASSESEQRALVQKVHLLEGAQLDRESRESLEVIAEASRDRCEAEAILARMRVRGSDLGQRMNGAVAGGDEVRSPHWASGQREARSLRSPTRFSPSAQRQKSPQPSP
ncbi:unnamed protein product, partial [Polarella glacialis]